MDIIRWCLPVTLPQNTPGITLLHTCRLSETCTVRNNFITTAILAKYNPFFHSSLFLENLVNPFHIMDMLIYNNLMDLNQEVEKLNMNVRAYKESHYMRPISIKGLSQMSDSKYQIVYIRLKDRLWIKRKRRYWSRIIIVCILYV